MPTCPALYSAIRYSLQRGPMYLPSCPESEPTSFTTRPCLLRPVQLCGSTAPVPVDQFLFRQSRRRDCSERCSASQSTSRARDGIDAVHRTAKVMHRTRVRAHDRRGRCTLHTANLSRRIHNAAHATGSFLGYYECVKTSYDGDAIPRRAFRRRSPPTLLPLLARPAIRYLTRRVFLEVVGFVEPAEGGNAEVPRSRKSRIRYFRASRSHTRCVLNVVILLCTPFIRYSIIGIVIRSTLYTSGNITWCFS